MHNKIGSLPENKASEPMKRSDETAFSNLIKNNKFVTIWSSEKIEASFEDYLPVDVERQNIAARSHLKL